MHQRSRKDQTLSENNRLNLRRVSLNVIDLFSGRSRVSVSRNGSVHAPHNSNGSSVSLGAPSAFHSPTHIVTPNLVWYGVQVRTIVNSTAIRPHTHSLCSLYSVCVCASVSPSVRPKAPGCCSAVNLSGEEARLKETSGR